MQRPHILADRRRAHKQQIKQYLYIVVSVSATPTLSFDVPPAGSAVPAPFLDIKSPIPYFLCNFDANVTLISVRTRSGIATETCVMALSVTTFRVVQLREQNVNGLKN